MSAQTTQKTIDLLNRIIKKPPLTQKLLSKPPFRYLHDIISEVISTTNFASNLFSELESNSENVKEKDAKINYLNKIIKVVSLSTKVTLNANPAKIVAGLDPEDTNAFLQLLAKAVLKKIDATDAAQRVLNGDTAAPSKISKSVNDLDRNQTPQKVDRVSLSEVDLKKPIVKGISEMEVSRSNNVLMSKDNVMAEPEKPPPLPNPLSKANSENLLDFKANVRDQNARQEEPVKRPNARPSSARPPPPKIRETRQAVSESVVFVLN